MHKRLLKTAALLMAIAVGLGAFGAHVLKSYLDQSALAIFETGVRYQFYHSLSLLACGILYKDFSGKRLIWAARMFMIGILIFCVSLYALALLLPDYKFIGAITPLGGLSFIVGWLLLFAAFNEKK